MNARQIKKPPVRGVILDVDGTLIDSNDAHAHAWTQALREAGINASLRNVRGLIGMGSDHLLPLAADVPADSARGKGIAARRKEIFAQHLPSLHAFPMARELLQRMRTDGLKLIVASSAEKDELQQLLKLCGGDELIAHVTSSDDVDRSKPDPDVVRVALKMLAIPSTEVMMIGDTPYDVEAANLSHVEIIAFRCGGWSDVDLLGALAIYDDPADLLQNYARSPLKKRRVMQSSS